jgi:hypothetical protein
VAFLGLGNFSKNESSRGNFIRGNRLCAFLERENASLIQGKIGFETKMVIFKEKVKIVFFSEIKKFVKN